jgi:hypothetical protein
LGADDSVVQCLGLIGVVDENVSSSGEGGLYFCLLEDMEWESHRAYRGWNQAGPAKVRRVLVSVRSDYFQGQVATGSPEVEGT